MSKDRIMYVWERLYPHIIALAVTTLTIYFSFNPISSSKIDSLIDGIVTLDSIIIGFMGAIIPVILSMKNESKLVKYVFDRDKKGLFKKYISETIGYGLLDVCISLVIYVRDIITNKLILKILAFLFVYTFFTFMLSTYRSMYCMLKLIFLDDDTIETVAYTLSNEKRAELWKKKGSKNS